MKILFIQNFKMTDFDYRELINLHINAIDYEAEHFNTMEHALNYLEIIALNISLFPDKIPHFIFLDLHFIGKEGFDFLTHFDRINQQIDFKIKVIAIINATIPHYRIKCLEYNSEIICIHKSTFVQ